MPRGRKAPAAAATSAAPTLNLQIDLDGLTIGDLKVFANLKSGTADELAMVAMLNRCVVGGVDHLPLKALPQVGEALAKAMQAAQNPNS